MIIVLKLSGFYGLVQTNCDPILVKKSLKNMTRWGLNMYTLTHKIFMYLLDGIIDHYNLYRDLIGL